MANLTYNTNVFTNVHKWDDEFSYLGILLSGKLNQVNGQGFPLIDAIDIDWNGAYVKNLNAYIYTTEDLINLLDKSSDNISYISNNYVKWSELTEMEYKTDISYELSYQNTNDIYNIIGNLNNQYNILTQLSYSLVYKSRYIQIEYKDFLTESNLLNRDIFIYDNTTENFIQVDKDYVYEHQDNENYYRYLVGDTTYFEKEINRLKNSYKGVQQDINNINENLDTINRIVPEAYNYAYTAYQKVSTIEKYAIDGYNNSYYNSYLIGYHTTYNIYKPLDKSQYTDEELRNKVVFVYDDDLNTYIARIYNPFYTGQYYIFYDKIDGTGIEKEIELLNDKISDAESSIFDINAKSLDESYVQVNVNTDYYNKQKNIIIDVNDVSFDPTTGYISNGIITTYSLTSAFSYIFDWKII